MLEMNSLFLMLLAALVLLAILLFTFSVMQRREIRTLRENLPRLQEKSEEIVLSYTEQALRDMEHRLSSGYGQDMLAMQNMLHSAQQSDAARTDALGQRIDTALQGQDGRIRHLSDVLGERLTANDEKVERMRETLYQGLNSMRQENAAKLDEMRTTVDEKLHQTLNKRLGESFSLVNERLEQVYKGLGEMQTLANGVGDLKRVLTNVKTRGVWGEMQLGALLEETLAPGQYEQNVAVKPGTQERVEYAIRLPGLTDGQVLYLPIDAKFPIEAYIRLQYAVDLVDKQAAEAARTELIAALNREAARIASKYISPPYTTDFAIMYLPLEGLYAHALQTDGVAEKMQREKRVVLAGPSTFSALLNALQMGFRTLAIEQRSGEVWQLLGDVKAEFGVFADILDKTQQRLRQASESIETATRKTKTIVRKLRSVETIEGLGGYDAAEHNLPGTVEDEL